MEFNVFVIKQKWPLLVDGAFMTFFICSASLALGIVLGAILCYGKMRRRGVYFRISTVIIDVFRTLPELVPIFWIYSAGPLIFDFRITAVGAGIVALTLYAGAFLAEIFRAGLQAVPRGQYEAANSLGIPVFWVYGVVISPQALRMMIPPFVNFVCDLVKVSSLLSAIGITELAYHASVISGETFRYLEIFTVAGVLYFLIIFPLSMFARHREKKLAVAR